MISIIFENLKLTKSKLLHIFLFWFPGFNATVLAYGQTGSGKTFSMGTCCNQSTPIEMEGVIPRAIREIFGKISTMSDYDFTVRIAFIELYNEQLYDLLSTQVSFFFTFLLLKLKLDGINFPK